MAQQFADLGRLYDHVLKEAKNSIEQEVAKEVQEILKKYISRNFYEKYRINPTDQLWNSITVRSIKNGRQIVGLWIYFDALKIKHTSLFGSSSLGVKKGQKVYTPQWINDGWTFAPADMQTSFGSKASGIARIRDVAQEPHFMEDTIEALNSTAPHIRKLVASLRAKGIRIE